MRTILCFVSLILSTSLFAQTYTCRDFDFESRIEEEREMQTRAKSMNVELHLSSESATIKTEIAYENGVSSVLSQTLANDLKIKISAEKVSFISKEKILTPFDTEIKGEHRLILRLDESGEIAQIEFVHQAFGGAYRKEVISCRVRSQH